jgi:RNA polymerase sigma-70 factor, ECF subfamily
VRKHDHKAFTILIERHTTTMRKVLFAILNGNIGEIEDVEQEVLIALCTALPGFRFRSSFSTWFYRFCRNKAVDYLRRKGAVKRRELRIKERLELESPRECQYDPERIALDVEKRERVRRVLAGLNKRDREVIVMKDMDDMGLEEIAGLLKIPIGTAKSRLHRARRKVAGLMAKVV